MSKFTHSNTGEMFYCEFDTFDEAVESALDWYEVDKLYIGEIVDADVSDFITFDDVNDLLNAMNERASYEHGDAAEYWPQMATGLELALKDMIIEFVKENSIPLKTVSNIVTIERSK